MVAGVSQGVAFLTGLPERDRHQGIRAMTQSGIIVLGSGAQIPLTYQLTLPAADGICHGKLLGELDRINPVSSPDRLRLVCEDGLMVDLLITYFTGRGATFIGTVMNGGSERATRRINRTR